MESFPCYYLPLIFFPFCYFSHLLSMEPWAAAKKLLVSVVVPTAPVRVPSQRSLAPSVTSVTRSLLIRAIMKWSWGCAQISWHLPYSWGRPLRKLCNKQIEERSRFMNSPIWRHYKHTWHSIDTIFVDRTLALRGIDYYYYYYYYYYVLFLIFNTILLCVRLYICTRTF